MDNISSLLFPFFYPKVGKNYKLENAIAFIVKRYDGAVRKCAANLQENTDAEV